ncbi:oxygen-independent coproporphyrinogen III oxidase [Pseudomaricurvus sp. HS19]|uniref:oxygen-independent coproporphyrinogen III oxidase n=1 Tax=Pseudomaricurvus sp. HS19 TaxID=2692626 RepID=UPI001371EF8E|nr:oxygen-independent coproporphyrinogen III oxidase [Pseudomaricurvus sp. HS19]MYM63072.1 oxygen-independent coproporphyrinogen III oxidase [Pseudomaricurvus sp. HS19]
MSISKLQWNQAMIQRYDLAGPRYTSYPTAPQFVESYPAGEVEAAIHRSNEAARPLSLYFHIPFCDTICYYCGCNKIVTANRKRARPYLDSLFKEIELRAAQFDRSRPVHQLHWGGGTPTYISDTEKRELMAETRKHFTLLDDDSGEYSIEIHPGGLSPDTLAVLRELGFNRLSMGVQDFNPQVQKAVNRFNSVEEVAALSERARAEGFHSLSMDLIYGLPHQTEETVAATLEQVIELGPQRLSLFNYAHLPHLFKSQKQMDASALPEPQVKLNILRHAIERLQAAGYVYIGMDHFAKPDDPLAIAQEQGLLQRNFQGYATHGNCDLLAFGVSSISAIDSIFVQNYKDIPSYTAALDAGRAPSFKGLTLTDDDLLRQAVINQLICHFELDFHPFEHAYGINFRDYFAGALQELKPLADDGLITLHEQGLQVCSEGRLLIRRICMAFDAYLKAPQPVSYSRIL